MSNTTVNLEALAENVIKLDGALRARHGTTSEFHQGIANAVNLGVEYLGSIAHASVSIALDTRRIVAALEKVTCQ